MSRVITFSRNFPATHPRKGEPTFFVEKVWKGLYEDWSDVPFPNELSGVWSAYCEMNDLIPKWHTIRAGNRWKVGDWFSPRVWSGLPYRSKQIQFAPDIQIKKIWPITIEPHKVHRFAIHIGRSYVADWKGTANIKQDELAANDGLTKSDLLSWFKLDKKIIKPFSGQIICWNSKLEYYG